MLNQVQEQPEGVKYLTRIVRGTYTSPVLFIGDNGVGKRFSVLQAIKESASRGDLNSPALYQINNNSHPDVCLISSEEDKDIGIDAVREILKKSTTHPMVAPYKYLVVDGADRLTNAAANALLKTLEEPPAKTRFFLLAECTSSIIPTIRSRCSKVRYNRLSEEFILHSVLPLVSDKTKALVYTRLADGSLGRAISYFGSNRLTLRDRCLSLLKVCLSGDASAIFSSIEGLSKIDLLVALRFLEHLLYDLFLLSYDSTKVANQDILRDLQMMHPQIESRLPVLRGKFYELVHTYGHAQISLEFHLKNLFASVFVG